MDPFAAVGGLFGGGISPTGGAAGPSRADSRLDSGNSVGYRSGDFNVGGAAAGGSMFAQLAPWLAVLVVAWLLLRRK